MIQVLNNQFTDEVSIKQDRLDQVQEQVIETTRELASLRRQLAEENAKSAHLDRVAYQRQNLERALKAELADAGLEANGATDAVPSEGEIDPSVDGLSEMEDEEQVVHLRRIRDFQKAMEEKLQAKVASAQAVEARKLEEYKKAMATRLKLPVEAIDEVSSPRPPRIVSADSHRFFRVCWINFQRLLVLDETSRWRPAILNPSSFHRSKTTA